MKIGSMVLRNDSTSAGLGAGAAGGCADVGACEGRGSAESEPENQTAVSSVPAAAAQSVCHTTRVRARTTLIPHREWSWWSAPRSRDRAAGSPC